jgi:UDP:flavonoid glycosyltransferase YjiC (YdhE family)
MISGKKVLCAAQPVVGHTVPAMALGLALREAGNDLHALSYGQGMDHLFDRYRVSHTPMPWSRWDQQDVAVSACVDALRRGGPDVTICDWRYDVWCALQLWRPPCRVSILRSACLLGYQRINPLLLDKFGFGNAQFIEELNVRHKGAGLSLAIKDLRELFTADVIVLDGLPEIDPLPDAVAERYPDTTFVHTGPLFLPIAGAVDDELGEWVDRRREEGVPMVLLTLGTVGWGRKLYSALADGFEAADFAVVMIVPFAEERAALQQRSGARLRVTAGTDLDWLARRADVAVHHCGHGTLHSMLLAATPSVTLPSGEYDREDDALRLEQLGCSRHLGHDSFRWGFRVPVVVDAIRAALSDREMRIRVDAMAARVRDFMEAQGPSALARALAERLGCRTPAAS